MKYLISYIVIFWILLGGCKKNPLQPGLVFTKATFSSQTVTADGSSTIDISVTLNSNADSTRRNVLFEASDGSFINGKDSSISQKAIFVNGQLVSKVTFVAPMKPETIYFNIQPDLSFTTNISEYDSVTATISVPSKIKLNESSFGVRYDFLSEDTLTAKLSNANGGNVSLGTKVIFEDSTDNGPAGGRYRLTSAGSNSSSMVSTIYSPGLAVPVGGNIFVRVSVVGKPDISDSVIITVIP